MQPIISHVYDIAPFPGLENASVAAAAAQDENQDDYPPASVTKSSATVSSAK